LASYYSAENCKSVLTVVKRDALLKCNMIAFQTARRRTYVTLTWQGQVRNSFLPTNRVSRKSGT